MIRYKESALKLIFESKIKPTCGSHVEEQSGTHSFRFRLEEGRCGTTLQEDRTDDNGNSVSVLENTIVVQYNPSIQVGDMKQWW